MTPRFQPLRFLVYCFVLFAWNAAAASGEFRGFWVDAFNTRFTTSEEVARIVSDVRAARANAVLLQVRKRADAYYASRHEPLARELAGGEFDPLAELLAQARDTHSGPRLEVHAWMNAYPAWRADDGWPSVTNHPYLAHPDWLNRTARGETFDGKDYSFDPGHAAVQAHLFTVAMDLVSRYELDGLHLDYLRYPGRNWGYSSNAVERFNRRYSRQGQPAPEDPLWSQFRREQVSALLRKPN